MRNTDTRARSTASRLEAPRARPAAAAGAALVVQGLDVYYGQAHALQGVSLALEQGVLAVVGRNGMGKTTLCKAITGMVPARGSVQFGGQELLGLTPDRITHQGVAYVPQGRRVWRSLTVDETLRLSSRTARRGAWTVERVYEVFPRLAERRANGGAQLSGGEQQMLAIGRALLFNPRLLVMDEPTEGLAPVIVEQVASLLKTLADDRSMSILLIEQNLGVALEVADQVAILVNGRIAHQLPAQALAADRALQQRLLGLKAGASDAPDSPASADSAAEDGPRPVLRLVRAYGGAAASYMAGREAAPAVDAAPALPAALRPAAPAAPAADKAVYLAGAWDRLPKALAYTRRRLEQAGARVVAVDLLERGLALPDYLAERRDLGALLVLVDGQTAAAGCAGALALPSGIPKLIVSARPLAGVDADIFSITAPIDEFNRVTELLLAHAVSAVAGMLHESVAWQPSAKPLVAITALELGGSAVRQVRRALGGGLDCLVLDMARGGAARLTRLAKSGLLAGVIDLAPVDVAKAVMLGQDGEAQARFAALAGAGIPYLCVPALLEVAAFSEGQAVPGALLLRGVLSSPQDGSVVPVSRKEAEAIAEWLADQLNRFAGPVRLLLPRPDASALHKLGGGGESVLLQQAVFQGLSRRIKTSPDRCLIERPEALHELRFGEAVASAMRELLRR